MRREVVYFEESSPENTDETIEAARRAAETLGLKYIVVATGTGATGVKVAEAFKDMGIKVVAVTEYAGAVELKEENVKRIRELGGEVVTGIHALFGVEDSLSKLYPGHCSGSVLIKETLRRFSQGTKVAAEIVMMATDAGAIPEGVDVVAMAGTGSGCDTAYVIKSSHASMFFDKEKGLEFREVVALPRKKKFW
ncbi:MAG: pyruvate kinase alpha/beta domain-containing protein [Candidatus Bathyarchaeia archaeon]